MISWRAGCGESRTSGSGGGSGKRIGRNDRHRASSRPHLAGDKLDLCRQRIQQQTCGHRGRTGDPLYGVRRILRTRLPLLSARRKAKLEAVFADENHLAVEICWGFYQRLIAAYAHPDRRRGKIMMTDIITTLRTGGQSPAEWWASTLSSSVPTGRR